MSLHSTGWREVSRAAPVFAALGDETRLALVARLSSEGPLSITRLTAGSAVTRQAITKHLDVLATAGLVSDLRRAVETAEIAFTGTEVPVLHDWRLRECDYGDLNGSPAATVHASVTGVDDRYPNGESWADAVARVGSVLDDIGARWRGRRVLIIGHMSAYWALEHRLHGLPLEEIGRRFDWQEGWEYELP